MINRTLEAHHFPLAFISTADSDISKESYILFEVLSSLETIIRGSIEIS